MANDPAYDDSGTETTDDGDSWWNLDLADWFLVVGLVLFLFPEPATSGIGVGLLIIGVVLWVLEAVF